MADRRVILVNRVYWPSTEATAQLLTDLAENLAARGWDVHVVAAGEASTRHHNVTIHRTGPGESHRGLLSRALNYRRFLRRARARLQEILQPDDVLVALTDPPMLGALAAEVGRAAGARVVHWVQDIYPEIAAVHFGALARPLLAGMRARRDAAWQSAAACVALGEDMALRVRAAGVPAERVHLLPNWAPRELHESPSVAAIAERRRQAGLDGRFVVTYSGNLGRVHEFATILAAAQRLREDVDVVFQFVGRGARFAAVESAVRQRGLVNVRLLPPEPRATLPLALASADAHLVTLLPAYASLVYPSKLAGVLAAGRPVLFVGPAQGDIARLLAANDCGASFAPGDGAGLAETILRWKFDPPAWRGLGAKARTAYLRHFAAETMLDRWDELLRRLASSG